MSERFYLRVEHHELHTKSYLRFSVKKKNKAKSIHAVIVVEGKFVEIKLFPRLRS